MECKKDNFDVFSYKQAKLFLNGYFFNDPVYNEIMEGSDFNSSNNPPQEWQDLSDVVNYVLRTVDTAYKALMIHESDEMFNKKLKLAVECIICNKLHENVMRQFHRNFNVEDRYLFDKIMELDAENLAVEQLGGSKQYSTLLHAPIVEFSNLDAYRNPIEKLHCVQTTFDMIYAQLKSEFAEINEDNNDYSTIPIIENEDVLSILMIVLIKSKPKHLYSNIVYIGELSSTLKEEDEQTFSNVIDVFCNAIERINAVDLATLPAINYNIDKELNYLNAMELISDADCEAGSRNEDEKPSFLNYHIRRIKRLISESIN